MKTSLDTRTSGTTSVWAIRVGREAKLAWLGHRYCVAMHIHNPGDKPVWIAPTEDGNKDDIVLTPRCPGSFKIGPGETMELDAPGRLDWNCVAEENGALSILDYIVVAPN